MNSLFSATPREEAIVFGLEMAIQKYGSQIACTGTDQWKRMVTMTAVKHGIFVQFKDPEMQGALHQQQLFANPIQLRTARLHSIETRLRTEEADDLIFTDEADARLVLSSLQPSAQAQQMVEVLKASQHPEPQANVGGNLTIALLRSPTGQQSFKISIPDGKRQEIIDRVSQLRQTAYWALRNNVKTPSQEREGRKLIADEIRLGLRSAKANQSAPGVRIADVGGRELQKADACAVADGGDQSRENWHRVDGNKFVHSCTPNRFSIIWSNVQG